MQRLDQQHAAYAARHLPHTSAAVPHTLEVPMDLDGAGVGARYEDMGRGAAASGGYEADDSSDAEPPQPPPQLPGSFPAMDFALRQLWPPADAAFGLAGGQDDAGGRGRRRRGGGRAARHAQQRAQNGQGHDQSCVRNLHGGAAGMGGAGTAAASAACAPPPLAPPAAAAAGTDTDRAAARLGGALCRSGGSDGSGNGAGGGSGCVQSAVRVARAFPQPRQLLVSYLPSGGAPSFGATPANGGFGCSGGNPEARPMACASGSNAEQHAGHSGPVPHSSWGREAGHEGGPQGGGGDAEAGGHEVQHSGPTSQRGSAPHDAAACGTGTAAGPAVGMGGTGGTGRSSGSGGMSAAEDGGRSRGSGGTGGTGHSTGGTMGAVSAQQDALPSPPLASACGKGDNGAGSDAAAPAGFTGKVGGGGSDDSGDGGRGRVGGGSGGRDRACADSGNSGASSGGGGNGGGDGGGGGGGACTPAEGIAASLQLLLSPELQCLSLVGRFPPHLLQLLDTLPSLSPCFAELAGAHSWGHPACMAGLPTVAETTGDGTVLEMAAGGGDAGAGHGGVLGIRLGGAGERERLPQLPPRFQLRQCTSLVELRLWFHPLPSAAVNPASEPAGPLYAAPRRAGFGDCAGGPASACDASLADGGGNGGGLPSADSLAKLQLLPHLRHLDIRPLRQHQASC